MSIGESATSLGKVEGLGSSHHGGGHWLEERFSSVSLVLLGLWLVFSLVMLPDLSFDVLKEWLRSAWAAIPMALLIVTAFRHGAEGLKVPVDDYIHDDGTRIGLHFAIDMAAIAGASAALFALAKIAFGAAA